MKSFGRYLSLAFVSAVPMSVECHAASAPSVVGERSKDVQTPDWSGSWSAFFGPIEASSVLEPAIRPDKRAAYQALLAKYLSAQLSFRDLYCRPYLFGGFSEGAEGNIEFTYSPGEVLLLWEGGLVRRIYTDGRQLDADQQIASAGSSRGRWEGDTLVIDTQLNPEAGPFLGYLRTSDVQVGKNAHLSERIRLKDADTLEFDITLIAPELLTGPVNLKIDYNRDRGYLMGEYTRCTDSDRSLDSSSGRIGYDMTPPADLPPPPK